MRHRQPADLGLVPVEASGWSGLETVHLFRAQVVFCAWKMPQIRLAAPFARPANHIHFPVMPVR